MDEKEGESEPQRAPWSPQDSRAWIISFGAGLAANLATVLVVGAAVVALRWERGLEPHHRLNAAFWVSLALSALLAFGLVLVVLTRLQRRAGAVRPLPVRRILVGVVLAESFLLLLLIGEAAGIK